MIILYIAVFGGSSEVAGEKLDILANDSKQLPGKKASSRFTVVSAPYKFGARLPCFRPLGAIRLAVGFLPGLTALRQPQRPSCALR